MAYTVVECGGSVNHYGLRLVHRVYTFGLRARHFLFHASTKSPIHCAHVEEDDGVPVFDCMRVCRLPAQIQNGTRYPVVVFDANPAAAPMSECVCARGLKCKVHRILSCISI